MRKTTIPTLAAVLALTAACNEGTVVEPVEEGLAIEDLSLVAVDGDAITGAVVFAQVFGAAASGAPAGAGEARDFSRSRECAAGGTIEINGTVERTENGEGMVEATVTGTRDQVNCTRTREDRTLVINGSGTFNAHRMRVNGEPVGIQTTSWAGSFDWTKTVGDADPTSGSCTYSLESVRNPETLTVHVTGTICDREIDRTRTWGQGT